MLWLLGVGSDMLYLAKLSCTGELIMKSQVLIFVFDVQSSDVQKDIEKYQSCIETGIMKYSPEAMVSCLML